MMKVHVIGCHGWRPTGIRRHPTARTKRAIARANGPVNRQCTRPQRAAFTRQSPPIHARPSDQPATCHHHPALAVTANSRTAGPHHASDRRQLPARSRHDAQDSADSVISFPASGVGIPPALRTDRSPAVTSAGPCLGGGCFPISDVPLTDMHGIPHPIAPCDPCPP